MIWLDALLAVAETAPAQSDETRALRTAGLAASLYRARHVCSVEQLARARDLLNAAVMREYASRMPAGLVERHFALWAARSWECTPRRPVGRNLGAERDARRAGVPVSPDTTAGPADLMVLNTGADADAALLACLNALDAWVDHILTGSCATYAPVLDS